MNFGTSPHFDFTMINKFFRCPTNRRITFSAILSLLALSVISFHYNYGDPSPFVEMNFPSASGRFVSALFSPSPSSSSGYGSLACPLENERFSPKTISDHFFSPGYIERNGPSIGTREAFLEKADEARAISSKFRTVERVKKAMKSGSFNGRRVVLIGDLMMHQNFISLGCHAWDSVTGYIVPWRDGYRNGMHIDGRIGFINGGEFIYSPRAGGLLDYDWKKEQTIGRGVFPMSMGGTMPWLDACKAGENFSVNSMAYLNYQKLLELSTGDIVFINAGTHSTYAQNHNNIIALLNCITQAKMEGKANRNWPEIHYVMTGQEHPNFWWAASCNTHNNRNLNLEEELSLYSNREQIVGANIDLQGLGRLHVGGRGGDCINWLQPGVPDLFAAEIMEKVVADAENMLAETGESVEPEFKVIQQPRKEEEEVKDWRHNLPSSLSLHESCPFRPDNSAGHDILSQGYQIPLDAAMFDVGLFNGLCDLIKNAVHSKTVLDLNARLGHLQVAFLKSKIDVSYLEFYRAFNIMNIVN